MKRRNFLSLTGTFTGGLLVLPEFLNAATLHIKSPSILTGNPCVVFLQLNGGNDGLNTFIPFDDPVYYNKRPNIAISKNDVIGKHVGMGFHPSLTAFDKIQQEGNLSVIQNVGYPEPNRSHFRSQEIWQTASNSNQYLSDGWLGRYLDLQCKEHNPIAGMNIDSIDNLALKGNEPNFTTVKNPQNYKTKRDVENIKLSDNPHLDFVRKIANSVVEGSEDIQNALKNSKTEVAYPKTNLGKNLEWIARLVKGNLNSKIYYTTMGGYDTHDNQLNLHKRNLTEVNDAIAAFYEELKQSKLLQNVTLVVFSEFGRRVADNGNGTDHGTAQPLFIIGGANHGKILGKNPNLSDLDNGDLKHQIDFRSVYATILKYKLDFDPKAIGITSNLLNSLF